MSIHTLMFGWEYPPLHLGGLGVACQGLVHGLLQNGVDVTLVLPHPHEQTEDHDVIAPKEYNAQTVRVRSMLHPYITVNQYFRKIHAMSKEMQQVYGHDLPHAVTHFTEVSVELTKHTQPHIVHCHDWMTYGAGVSAAKHHQKPLVAHIHATELDRTDFHPNEWIYNLERKGFIEADRIVAVSQYTKNILVEHYGISPDKIAVIHNGMSEAYLKPASQCTALYGKERMPMVLFLGRLTMQKGPMQFLDMAAKIHKIQPSVQFVMAGEGAMLEEIMAKATACDLERNITFTGKVSTAEARKLYTQADCFVMPSLSEPFGLVALEAMSHGIPIVISKQSGVSEVVGHGFKVDFWDTDKMADCVLTILREQPLAQQLRAEAPRSIRNLRWENQAQKVRALYENLLR